MNSGKSSKNRPKKTSNGPVLNKGCERGGVGLAVLKLTMLSLISSQIILFIYVYSFPNTQTSRSLLSHAAVLLDNAGVVEKKHAVVIDAGSTGSRVLAFSFYKTPLSGDLVLTDELWHEEKPGLSSYADQPHLGGESIKKLLDIAKGRIPHTYWSSTIVTLKATAGLRLLPEEKSRRLIDTVTAVLNTSGFAMGENDPGVEIMSGLDEGIFGWTTVNFLLNKLQDLDTSGVALDLGGGSTQITFTPTHLSQATQEVERVHKTVVGGKETSIYSHSYLGLGLMAARQAILKMSGAGSDVSSPCVSQTASQQKIEWSYNEKKYTISRSSDGGFASCKAVIDNMISNQGMEQLPELKDRALIGFSYFFDRALDAGLIPSVGGEIKIGDFIQAARKFCDGKVESGQELLCLDLSFISGLLATGYGLEERAPIGLYKKINGHETSWALGAAFSLIQK